MPWSFFGYFPYFMSVFCDYISHLSLALEIYFFGLNIGSHYNASLAAYHETLHISNISFDDYVFFDHIQA